MCHFVLLDCAQHVEWFHVRPCQHHVGCAQREGGKGHHAGSVRKRSYVQAYRLAVVAAPVVPGHFHHRAPCSARHSYALCRPRCPASRNQSHETIEITEWIAPIGLLTVRSLFNERLDRKSTRLNSSHRCIS